MGDLQNAMGCDGMDRTEGQGMSYDKLVAALRCKRDDCEGCDLAFFDKDEGWMCQYAAKDDDAADAIEALQAEVERLTTENKELAADRPEMVEADGHWEWRKPNGEVLMPKLGEIVRCGECKYYVIAQLKSDYTEDKRYNPSVCVKGEFAVPHKSDWFCADGER
jgi:hypothetical protein